MTSKKKIMVVEDNRLNREILVEILAGQYTVLEAENGLEALKLLAQYHNDVALILLDMIMPVMDGYTFLDKVKADPELALIPVILMTQSGSEESEVEALAHGATDFMPKPYRPQIILHRVANIIKLRENAAMANQFKYDQLTGLYSREYFYRRVWECLLEDPNGEYNIVCSNIENFKVYNDSFGVKAGDRLLRQFADRIRETVGKEGVYGRFGADRFLILQNRATELADREAMISALNSDGYTHSNIVTKWGIYEITDRSVPVEQMCDRAFLAADSIKGQYNQFLAVYDDTLRSKLLQEQAITESMETALQEGQFAVYLQPKYNLNNDALAGAEALVRWNHPQWGFLSPGTFIPLFEKNGFISRLDEYVWEQVCALLRDWNEKGYPRLPVSVNVSRVDIYRENLVEQLSGLVKKYGIEPAQLHLELTESAYTKNPSQIITTVERLRALGFIVELDDFGSGYSSLNMLNQMKMDILKLDMKFIQSETAVPSEPGILQFIINLARWMHLRVVAEGVETRAQLERLRELGCDYAQGYFFAKPMPAPEYEALLRMSTPEHAEPETRPCEDGRFQKCLLLVDDDPVYRGRVRSLFGEQYRILEADSADGAIASIRENSGVNVVILSMSLPEAGAERVLQAMRQDSASRHIPVVAVLPNGESAESMLLHLDTDDFLCKCHPLYDLRRRVERLLNIAAFQERSRKLQDVAYRDYLTGLLNRRGFFASLEALQQEDLPLALYLFDLDNMKQVNDCSGHKAGDTMLRAFGELLRSFTRDGDILCRYGGDEFVMVLRHISSVDAILKKGETICREFRNKVLPDGSHPACTAGIVLSGADEKPTAALIERADRAMYYAKRNDKGSCCLWDKSYDCPKEAGTQ